MLGLTQKELADQAGVSERLVRSLEMGTAYGIGLEKLVNIISPLGLSLSVTSIDGENQSQNGNARSISQGDDYSRALKHAVLRWEPISPDVDGEEQR